MLRHHVVPVSSFSPRIAYFAAFSLLVLAGGIANAQSANVTLEVFPNSVQFPVDGSEVQITAILKNGTADGLGKAKIRRVVASGVRIEPLHDLTLDVAPNADATWDLKITRTPGVKIPATVNLIADYERLPEKGKPFPKASVGQLGLMCPEIETNETPVTAEVLTDLETLHSGDKGTLDVVLTNNTSTTLRAAVTILLPEPNSLKVADPPRNVTLLPRSKGMIRIPVEAHKRVRVGKQTVEFVVDVSWGSGAEHQRRAILAKRQINLDVFAESTVLDLMGKVPLLLFLPGILVIQTWSLLWRVNLFRTRGDTQTFPLQASTLDFYMVAIVISFLLLLVHQIVGFDYIGVYGFPDLVTLYLLSVGIYGASTYVVTLGGRWVYIRRRVPTASDGPVMILKRLGRQGLGLALWYFDQGTAPPRRVFMLEPPTTKEDRPKTWIAPPMTFIWLKGASDPDRKQIELKLKEIMSLGPDGDAGKAARLISQAVNKKIAQIDWETSGGISRPVEVETAITNQAGPVRTWILEIHEVT